MNKIIIPVLASVLILGVIVTGLTQDVFAPNPRNPEKIAIGPIKSNAETQEFEIKVLVHLPKGSDFAAFTVVTNLELFLKDGTSLGASLTSSDPVPAGVKEGGNNSSIHKLLIRMAYVPPEELIGEKVQVVVTSELLNPDGNSVDQTIKKTWKKFAKSFR